MQQLPQVILEGIFTGSIISLVALGLSLVWGTMNFINFAQSEFLMIGMYLSFLFTVYSGLDPLFCIPLVCVVMYFFGVLLYKGLIKKTLNAPTLTQILITASLSIVLTNLTLMIFTGEYRTIKTQMFTGSFEFMGMMVVKTKLVPLMICIVVSIVVYYIFNKTNTGRAIKATSMNPTSAALVGVNPDKTYAQCFGISAAVTGCAGVALSYYFYIYPQVGSIFSNLGFVAVCIGGMGSIPGALLGGLIMGLIDSIVGVYISASIKYLAIFVTYIVIITKRPKGLFGW